MLVKGKEKRVVKGPHPALVDEKTFERVQSALQHRAFYLTSDSSTPITPNILKGKVICGCCGSKMQRRRGTNHASWYFFTCPTNNRVGSDRCTGMHVREKDIFSAYIINSNPMVIFVWDIILKRLCMSRKYFLCFVK